MKTFLKFLNRILPLFIVIGVTVALFISPYIGKKPSSPKKQEKGPRAITVVRATKDDLREEYQSIGNAAGWSDIKITSQIEGVLTDVDARPGDLVRKGKRLAFLDDRLLQADLRKAEVSLLRSTEELKRVEELASKQLASQSRLQAAVAQKQVDEAVVDKLRTQISLSQFPSPIDGVITGQMLYPGDTVRPGSVLFTMADVSRIRIFAKVPEEIAAKLKAGDTVLARAGSSDMMDVRDIRAMVYRIYPSSDPVSHQVTIEIDAGNAFPSLKPGFIVTTVFTTANRRQVLTLDRRAIQEDPKAGEATVFVVRDNHAEKRKIKLGLVLEERVEVVKGLSDGEAVILHGTDKGDDKLKDGAEVKVMGESLKEAK